MQSPVRGQRARRRRLFTACVATFLVPIMVLDPQSVNAMFNEAMASYPLSAAGIGQPGPTGNATVASVSSSHTPSAVGVGHTAYDADGIRNSRTVAGAATWHLTDKNRPYAQVLTETDAATGALRVRYTYGDDLISQTRPDPADPGGNPQVTRYYHYDGQMSTRQLTDAAEGAATAVTDTYTYDAYGNLLASTGDTVNAYRYTGEQFDEAIGQYYLRARYYDQAVGRFTARDTYAGSIQDPYSLHRYLYAHTNPVNNRDPSGKMTLAGTLATFGLIAILTSILLTSLKGALDQAHIVTAAGSRQDIFSATLRGDARLSDWYRVIWGAYYGAGSGILNVLDTMSFRQIDILHEYRNATWQADGLESSWIGTTAGGFAWEGTGLLYSALIVWTHNAAGVPQMSVSVRYTAQAPKFFHFEYGANGAWQQAIGRTGAMELIKGYGEGIVISGIPVLYPEAVMAGAGSTTFAYDCGTAVMRAIFRGWGGW